MSQLPCTCLGRTQKAERAAHGPPSLQSATDCGYSGAFFAATLAAVTATLLGGAAAFLALFGAGGLKKHLVFSSLR